MADPVITSTANPLVKRIRALDQRKHRLEEGAFFVEGIRPVWQAVESRAGVELLVVAPELLTSEAAKKMVDGQRRAGIPIFELSPRVFMSLAQRENPSGLGAIVRTRRQQLSELRPTPESFFVAIQEAHNPGNLGAIIRTADGVGASGVILIGPGTDPHNPTAVKASMGTLFSMPIAYVDRVPEVVEWSREHGIKVITTSSRAEAPYWSVNYPRPALYLFGSEGEGLSDEELEKGDLSVRIPMQGTADSLNLAVSVGVLLYEVKRQAETRLQKVDV